jgi:hypothetical protein
MADCKLCVTKSELEQFMADTERSWDDLRKLSYEELNELCNEWLEQKTKSNYGDKRDESL